MPIYIKQYNLNTSCPIYVKQFDKSENYSVIYNLDDYSISRAIIISTDEKNWSGPFGIENIEDFQIKVLSNQTEDEKRSLSFTRD